jgi:hypothetical protein
LKTQQRRETNQEKPRSCHSRSPRDAKQISQLTPVLAYPYTAEQ